MYPPSLLFSMMPRYLIKTRKRYNETMGVHTYSIDDKVATRFKDKTPEQETSSVLEQLMRDYLDESPKQDIQLDLTKNHLSKSQQNLLELMIEKNIHGRSTQSLMAAARRNDIYSRSHHFGEGLRAVIESESNPYIRGDNGDIKSGTIKCSCGASNPFHMVVGKDGECPKCGKKIVRMP